MRLTKNFYKIEFESRDGAPMPYYVFQNIKKLAKNLQVLRDYIGRPIHINSAYRSPQHNKNIGGVKNSKHVLGKAADISVKNMSPRELAHIIMFLIDSRKMTKGGIGLYNGFVHYDIRGYKARWDYSNKYDF